MSELPENYDYSKDLPVPDPEDERRRQAQHIAKLEFDNNVLRSETQIHSNRAAAAADRIAKLEAALYKIADPKNWSKDGVWFGASYPDDIAREALGRGE